MDGMIVSLNELLSISDSISLNAEKHKMYNQLLDEKVCDQYDVLDIKKKLQDLFVEFRSAKYLYNFPIADTIRTTPTYTTDESFHQRSNVSQVEKAVSQLVDKQLFTTNIYNSILKISYKLINEEVIYLINTFLGHKSEDDIAEIIGISKTYLQKIKKSCIVKMWIDLKPYCELND